MFFFNVQGGKGKNQKERKIQQKKMSSFVALPFPYLDYGFPNVFLHQKSKNKPKQIGAKISKGEGIRVNECIQD